MGKAPELVALVDLDGTLANFDGRMNEHLRALASPAELEDGSWNDMALEHIEARRSVIKRQPGFWRSLEPIQAGFEVYRLIEDVGFEPHVLTKGPFNTTTAWTEKVEWCRDHLIETPVTITADKGLVYGRILFDDWPSYISRWLEWRPRGLVVMLDWPWNQKYHHPNVFRFRQDLSGDEHTDQLGQLCLRLQTAKNRRSGESGDYTEPSRFRG